MYGRGRRGAASDGRGRDRWTVGRQIGRLGGWIGQTIGRSDGRRIACSGTRMVGRSVEVNVWVFVRKDGHKDGSEKRLDDRTGGRSCERSNGVGRAVDVLVGHSGGRRGAQTFGRSDAREMDQRERRIFGRAVRQVNAAATHE